MIDVIEVENGIFHAYFSGVLKWDDLANTHQQVKDFEPPEVFAVICSMHDVTMPLVTDVRQVYAYTKKVVLPFPHVILVGLPFLTAQFTKATTLLYKGIAADVHISDTEESALELAKSLILFNF